MTRAEAIEILRYTPIDIRTTREGYIHSLYATAQIMAIEALAGLKWIPVTERLPKTKGTYLVTVPQLDGVSEFIYISVWTGNEWIPSNRILAWMPLPEPYKEGDEQ